LPDWQTVRPPPKKLVVEAVVEKRLVVVALVLVALRAVKFWRVDEPLSKRLERVAKPPVAVRVPVKLAALEIVWPLILPAVMRPVLRAVEKRLVLEAVVAKKLVEVAEVPVALMKVKFWRVVEPITKRSPDELMVEVAEPPILKLLPEKMEEKRLVEVA
jgi:hypothetical protein